MAEQTLLIIDPNPQSLNVMEVQLRKDHYEVIGASSVERAEQIIEVSSPDLIVCDYHLDGGLKAPEFCRRLKAGIATRSIPLLTIVDQDQQRVDCLGEGADDVLVKPLYMAELKDRAELLLQRRRRLTLERGVGQRFFGRLEEMGLLDLMQVIEVSRRSGALVIEHQSHQAKMWFKDGVVHDAELKGLSGESALKRLLTWEFGQYEFDFQGGERPNEINRSLEEIKSRGLAYVDQWHKISEQLPSLETVFRQDPGAITDRFEPLESSLQSLIDLFDGQLSALEVIDRSRRPDIEALQGLTQLYFEGLIYEVDEVSHEPEPEPAFIDVASPEGHQPESEDLRTPEIEESVLPLTITPKDGPPPSDEPPSLQAELDDLMPPPLMSADLPPEVPEEGQDLLAELYAARPPEGNPQFAFELTPPPVPDSLPNDEDLDQADETYSTLFGAGGEFSYDDEESAFFEQLDQSPEDLFGAPEERSPMGAGAKASLMIALLTIASITAYSLYDDVKGLRITQMIQPAWIDIELSGRQLSVGEMIPAEGDWKLELAQREVAAAVVEPSQPNSPRAGVDSPRRASSAEDKPKRKGGKSFAKLMKSAIKLQKAEKFQQSFEMVEEALSLKPGANDALLLAAVCSSELGRDRSALGYLQRLLQKNPGYGSKALGRGYGPGVVYNLIAFTYNNLGDKASALKHYETYLRTYPSGVWSSEIKSIVTRLKR